MAAIEDVRDAALFKARAKPKAITIAQRMVEDGASQPVVLNEDKGVLQRVRDRQLGTRRLERFRNVDDDKGSSSTMRIERPSSVGRFIRFPGAAKRKLPEAGRSRYATADVLRPAPSVLYITERVNLSGERLRPIRLRHVWRAMRRMIAVSRAALAGDFSEAAPSSARVPASPGPRVSLKCYRKRASSPRAEQAARSRRTRLSCHHVGRATQL